VNLLAVAEVLPAALRRVQEAAVTLPAAVRVQAPVTVPAEEVRQDRRAVVIVAAAADLRAAVQVVAVEVQVAVAVVDGNDKID
jgi:hypothetical protein